MRLKNMNDIQKALFAMQDISYRDFHSKLMPTVQKETIIGVRIPQLRKYAKELAKQGGYEAFLRELPHQYYEENNLHAFLIESIKDYDKAIQELEIFLPYVDNWATCDMMNPKVLGKHLPQLLEQIQVWMASTHPYTIRYGIGMLMRYYLDDAFSPEYPEMVARIRSEEYYVKMMVAWYFATALAKQYESAFWYIETYKLDDWCHNKAIQKAMESYRITEEQKAELRKLKKRK